ncbi:MAG: alanine--tRNA ligase [Anaerolineales bacterium]|nr:MAG: alanine--tRNA ligase [Anaerolineales bacterium]
MTSVEIRQTFLDFFASKDHTIVPSDSLVPGDDPTLLFTNAGMNQFKNIFLSLEKREYTRAADTQKCMRVSGKHNDLEDVGPSPYHHTFFEMLGNWSFGDYYKKEAIAWAWELLTEIWGLPKAKVWATVFEDDKGDLGRDEEAAGYWKTMTDINPDQILYFGRKDNFWEMGETGPCGPCSEIHLDRGPAFCDLKDDPNHRCTVNGDCRRFIELWNLVFIQYNCNLDGSLDELPAKHVDTGMGFERITAVLQGGASNYETDLFTPIMARTQELLGHSDAQRQADTVPYRVIADHGRAVTFLVGDGVRPGNEGREYVLRMILRRAARFGKKIGFEGPFLAEIAQMVINEMGPYFTELQTRREFILTTITEEEERFLHTLDVGLARLDGLMADLSARGQTVVPGKEAFVLWSQDGVPLDVTRDIAGESGFTVDEAGFHEAMEEHRKISSAGQAFGPAGEGLEVYSQLLDDLKARGSLGAKGVEHVYAENTVLDTQVVAMLREGQVVTSVEEGDEVEVVLAATPFYVESGGQISDTGFIARYDGGEMPEWRVDVTDARQPVPGLIVHVGRVVEGQPKVGDEARAEVDRMRRWDIARNHTATHLLHKALRSLLGEHVQQAGSLVAPDRLRFDFTHSKLVTQDQLDAIQQAVNDYILANYPVRPVHTSYKEAVAGGAIALFGEKYGEQVRVMKTGDPDDPISQELCGGTHVNWTSQIGLFQIVSESSIGAGLRRIEAVTGREAQRLVQKYVNKLRTTAAHLDAPMDEVDHKVLALLDEVRSSHKEAARLRREIARRDFESLLSQVEDVKGVKVLAAQVDADTMETLREMSDWFRDRLGSGVIVLGAAMNGRPGFVAAVTSDLVKRGLHAGQLVKAVAEVVGGGGGGKPTLAQAGGKDVSKVGDALQIVPGLVAEHLA